MATPSATGEVSKITITERRSLELSHNLADAQNYMALSANQREIVARLGDIFTATQAMSYGDIKRRFMSELYGHLRQPGALAPCNHRLLCYSATIGLEIAASFIRTRLDGRSVGLIHPTFDTLFYIARRHHLPVVPVEEDELRRPEPLLGPRGIGTLILTQPNNPTGFHLDRDQFIKAVTACKKSDVLLVIDCCYRFYCEDSFDCYAILNSIGINYLLVEDTGKIFPLLDIKLGVLNCNASIFPLVESIHSDFLLEVSAFSMAAIFEFFSNQTPEDRTKYLDSIESNRSWLVSELARLSVTPVGGRNINVQLLQLPRTIDSTKLQEALARQGVGVVDAKKLYWSSQPLPYGQIRVALSRDPDHFKEGVTVLRDTLASMLE